MLVAKSFLGILWRVSLFFFAMNSLNRVQLIGNLTADPEVKETPNGQKVATFSIATNRVWKDQAGQRQEETEYHNIVFWGRTAEICEQYLTKGKKIYVEGRLKTRSWEDQAGQKRYRTEIIGENLIMLSTGGGTGGTGGYDGGSSAFESEDSAPAKPRRASKPKGDDEIRIEDIPF